MSTKLNNTKIIANALLKGQAEIKTVFENKKKVYKTIFKEAKNAN